MSSIARVFSERILPVARGLDHVAAPPLVDALRAGGISSIEITVEAVGGIEAIAAVSRGEMKVGAGSVATIDQARKAVDAGAEFLVMPHLDIELVQWSRINDVALVPGGLTPNEIHAAWRNSPPAVKCSQRMLAARSICRACSRHTRI